MERRWKQVKASGCIEGPIAAMCDGKRLIYNCDVVLQEGTWYCRLEIPEFDGKPDDEPELEPCPECGKEACFEGSPDHWFALCSSGVPCWTGPGRNTQPAAAEPWNQMSRLMRAAKAKG